MLAILAVVLLLLASWFLIPDEDLRSEVVQILNAQPTVPPQQNAYYAMWGLKAAPSLDPHVVGKQILETLKQAHMQHRKISDADLQQIWGVSQLKIESIDTRFCSSDATECLLQFRAAREKIESSEHALEPYLKRYLALRSYPDFEEVLLASLNIPMVDLSDLLALSNLTDARIALDMNDKAKQKPALENLAAELRLWRKVGQNAESLITKMIAAAVLHRKFRLTSELLAESPEIAIQYPALLMEMTLPLTARETSIDRALIGEFRLTSGVFLDLAGEREIDNADSLSSIPGKLLMIGSFKPNASINLQYGISRSQRAFYTQPASVVLKQAPAFPAKQQNIFSPYSLSTLFYNPVGKVLVYVAPLDWGKYAYALHDLAAYTRLVELQRRIISAHINANEIPAFLHSSDASLRDPYTGDPMHWDAQSQSLSVQGHGKAHDALAVRVETISPTPSTN